MANANIFKKYLNLFIKNKQQETIIQRDNDLYYICNGYIMLRLPAVFYTAYARTLSPIFCELENGQSATRKPGEMLAKLDPPSKSMVKIFVDTETPNAATITDLFYITSEKKTVRYVKTGEKKITVYNNDYITAALDFVPFDQFQATADRFPALKWEDPTNHTACMVLPVNAKPCFAALNDLVEVLKK